MLFGEIAKAGVADADDSPERIILRRGISEYFVDSLTHKLGDSDIASLGKEAKRPELVRSQIDLNRSFGQRGHLMSPSVMYDQFTLQSPGR